MNSDNAHLFVL